MSRFYLLVWVRWALAFSAVSVLIWVGFATLMTVGSYMLKGLAPIDGVTLEALKTIWFFWAGVGYGIGIIGGLIGGLRYLCRKCIGGYRIIPLNCRGESIESVTIRSYFRIWRKWFFALIWANAAVAVFIVTIHKLVYGGSVWMGWFNPYWLTPMIVVSGLAALPVWIYRCKSIRIEPCR